MNDELYGTIKDFLIEKMNPDFIIIFGSVSKGTEHKKSDVDIAFYCENSSLAKYEIFMLSQKLANQIKREIDLVDLKTASTVFQAQIVSSGKVIYSKNDTLRMTIEMMTLSKYAKLNEERIEIIEKVAEKGSIYEK